MSLSNYSLQHDCISGTTFVVNSSSNPRTWIPVPIKVEVGDSNLWLRYIYYTLSSKLLSMEILLAQTELSIEKQADRNMTRN